MPLWVVVVAYSIPTILVGSPVRVTERRREVKKKKEDSARRTPDRNSTKLRGGSRYLGGAR